ncbi:MAG: SDR family oxidoreductase [Rhodospirillales bacterium]|jgi:NAD(P)-dependent dehydrogenase (short-subunit alcohol dehydrogenase family)|nr:SDR family oxidoreductase [Rhodospirillales bacterium]HJO71303.1 SDR family oxidoreductase [Rhodospirillales bacterium]
MPDTPPKAALITGAARRIGRAIALKLAAHGWAVAVHYNASQDDARQTVADITERGGRAAELGADLTREDEAAGLVARAGQAIGPLACLVNNASVFRRDTPETATCQSWDAHMEVNLRAPFVLTQAFARQLPEGIEGNVINIIDQRVWNLTPQFTSYTLSKAGLWTLTRTLALALAPRIRVNAIGPGPTLPNARQTDEEFDRQWASMPLRRRVGTGEIAATVRFILDAPAMTGQMIALDGGQHLGWAQGPLTDETME